MGLTKAQTPVERFQVLVSNRNTINTNLAKLQGQLKGIEERINEILVNNGVKDAVELAEKKKQLDAVTQEKLLALEQENTRVQALLNELSATMEQVPVEQTK